MNNEQNNMGGLFGTNPGPTTNQMPTNSVIIGNLYSTTSTNAPNVSETANSPSGSAPGIVNENSVANGGQTLNINNSIPVNSNSINPKPSNLMSSNNVGGVNNNLNTNNLSSFDIGINEQTNLVTPKTTNVITNQSNTNIGLDGQVGTAKESIPNGVTTNNIQTQSINNNQVEEELLKMFIYKNFEKITTKKFNFAGFFFGYFYLFYRKMFLYGLAVFILSGVISSIFNNMIISIIISLSFSVLIGALVNKMYISYVNKKINGIKTKNPQKSMDEIKSICIKKGGTSFGMVFLGLLVVIISSSMINFIIDLISYNI